MPNVSLNELKANRKNETHLKLQNMSKETLLSALDEWESAGSGNNFDNARIKMIKNDFTKFRYGFSRSKIKEIRKNFRHKKPKKLSKSKIKEIELNLIELDESLFKLNKYM